MCEVESVSSTLCRRRTTNFSGVTKLNVKTIAGQEDVPIQLIEQSPGQILDRVLMTDLIADSGNVVGVAA